MEFSLTSLLVLLVILFFLYYVANSLVFKTWNYFTDRGIVFERGYPIFGTFAASMLSRRPMADVQQEIYKRHADQRFIGVYQMGGRPSYQIHDPELVKAITVKDFEHFVNHGFLIDAEMDPLVSRVIFLMNDEKWREMRSILSPLFTGSKMRLMLSLLNDTIGTFISGVREEVTAAGPDQGVEYNLMDVFTCSTNDAIASCAFGMKMNSFKDKNNEFYQAGKTISYALQNVVLLFQTNFPTICKWLKVKSISDEISQYLRGIVHDNVEQRSKHNIVRNDMIHLMTLLRDGKLESIAEKEDLQDAGFATVSEFITAKATKKLRSK